MREIRFRAWDGQRFYYFDNHAYTLDYNDASGWGVHPNIPNYDKGPWTTGESSSSAEHFDLQQYIGLKDKNKKWIYEGDIVRHQGELFAVRWDRHLAQFALYTHDNERPKGSNKEWRFEDGLSSAKEYEVVGNIYDNPELLEEDEQ